MQRQNVYKHQNCNEPATVTDRRKPIDAQPNHKRTLAIDGDGNLRSTQGIVEDAVHELLHTLRIEHPFEVTQGTDTRLIHEGGNNYSTTSTTDPNINFNIMNYPHISIDGQYLRELWRTSSQKPVLITPDQRSVMFNEIKHQKQGHGLPGSEGYFDYWSYPPGEKVPKKE